MGEKPILTDKKEMIGIITLNRPEDMNTFNVPFARGLNDALRDMDKDDDVRVVVIRATGKHFSAGISLSEFEGKSPKELREFLLLMDEFYRLLQVGNLIILRCRISGAIVMTNYCDSDRIMLLDRNLQSIKNRLNRNRVFVF